MILIKAKEVLRKHAGVKTVVSFFYHFIRSILTYPDRKKLGDICVQNLIDLEKNSPKRIWYFCVPTHPNLGDQAQACCILNWFKKAYPEYDVVEISTFGYLFYAKKCLELLKKMMTSTDLIFFQSGYTMTGTHPDEIIHWEIVEKRLFK